MIRLPFDLGNIWARAAQCQLDGIMFYDAWNDIIFLIAPDPVCIVFYISFANYSISVEKAKEFFSKEWFSGLPYSTSKLEGEYLYYD